MHIGVKDDGGGGQYPLLLDIVDVVKGTALTTPIQTTALQTMAQLAVLIYNTMHVDRRIQGFQQFLEVSSSHSLRYVMERTQPSPKQVYPGGLLADIEGGDDGKATVNQVYPGATRVKCYAGDLTIAVDPPSLPSSSPLDRIEHDQDIRAAKILHNRQLERVAQKNGFETQIYESVLKATLAAYDRVQAMQKIRRTREENRPARPSNKKR